MRTDLFDFELPPERIALRPVVPRDAARLLVVRPGAAPEFDDRGVRDLPDLLRAGDALVVNDTKVIPARLHGRRIGRGDTEPAIEATLHRRLDGSRWRAFVKPGEAAGAGRRGALRRRRQGVLPRPARRHGRGEGRGRRGDARLRVPRAGARPGDRGARRHAVAALYRRAARARRARPRRLSDHVRAGGRLGRGADRGTAFHRRAGRRPRASAASPSTRSRCMSAPARSCRSRRRIPPSTACMPKAGSVERGDGVDALNAVRRAGGRIVAVGSTSLRLLESATRRGRRRSARSRARPRCSSRRATASARST